MSARGDALARDLAARARLADDPIARVVMGRSSHNPLFIARSNSVLGRRELEVLTYASRGLWPSQMIGDAMGIGGQTVQTYLKRARLKLGAKTNIQACCEAIRRGLIP